MSRLLAELFLIQQILGFFPDAVRTSVSNAALDTSLARSCCNTVSKENEKEKKRKERAPKAANTSNDGENDGVEEIRKNYVPV